jgi:hypothetical protein
MRRRVAPPASHANFLSRLRKMADLRSGAGPQRTAHGSCSTRASAACGREGGREEEFVAKSGKGQSAGTAGTKSVPKHAAKEIGRLEKRLQKARGVEAKRKKQATEARAEVAQLTAQIKELRPPTRARSAKAPTLTRAAPTARSRARAKPAAAKPAAAKPAAAKPAAAKPAAAKPAAAKPKVAVASTGTTATARRSSTSTSTRRKTASSAATRAPRASKTSPADGSGDGTGPT